ncbi:fibronectin type III domain-containing protein [Nocardioides caldifontis]|uniref:fibronectin type III domain-containing protein n=1 Tax=Nocardioides caldifontis TaxID=2588938 RepID=UPI0011E0372F|nr:hypothetical protein [Nocardioides caldifontis]
MRRAVVVALLSGLMTLGNIALLSQPAAADYAMAPRTTTWSPTSGRVYAIERVGGTVFIGGTFTALRHPSNGSTVTRNRLAAFDATTGELLPWNPGANGEVRALHADASGTGLFVGGAFTTIGGQTRQRLALLDASTGAVVTGFTANANGAVRAIERVGDRLFVAGAFTTVGGAARTRVAAVSATDGALVTPWSGSADAVVTSLQASTDGSRVFAGGQFRTLSGQPRDYIGAFDAANGAATSWRPPIPCTDTQNPCHVFDLAADSARVYAAVGGPGGRVVAWDTTTAVRRWAAYGDGDVQAIALEGGTVYAGGHFNPLFGQQERVGMVALSSTTGGVLEFAPRVFGNLMVFDILAEPGVLRIGGEFTRIGNSTAKQRYAEFPEVGGTTDTTPPSTPGGLRMTSVSDDLVSLSWNASTDDVVVSGYRIYRDDVLVAETGVTNHTDRPLQPATAYAYRVRAVDGAGNESPLSAALTVTTRPPSQNFVDAGDSWRYLSNGSNQGTAWRAPGFNDASWSVGNAQLGFGDSDETTVISPLGLTHYFRTQFTVADADAVSSLTARLLRDDGAVVHLNGTEVWRSNMPTGTIGYQTPAASDVAGAAESTFVEQAISAAALVDGTNTLAVEVHNRSGSDDVSFDLELVPTFGEPTQDTTPPSQPGNLRTTSVTSSSVALAWNASTDDVGVTGYQVRRDGALVATVTGTSWTDTGRTAGATHGYTVTAVDAAGNASAPSATLTVVVPSTTGPLQLSTTGATWRHRSTASAAPNGWQLPSFNDSTWASGPSQLGFGDGDEATTMTRGATTFYFRREVTVPDPSAYTTLAFELLRDDGAVVYVNGAEVQRTNMPSGPVTYSTLASSNISGNAENRYVSFTVPASVLVAGTNVIAIEVHQDATRSSDLSMDLRLTAR